MKKLIYLLLASLLMFTTFDVKAESGKDKIEFNCLIDNNDVVVADVVNVFDYDNSVIKLLIKRKLISHLDTKYNLKKPINSLTYLDTKYNLKKPINRLTYLDTKYNLKKPINRLIR